MDQEKKKSMWKTPDGKDVSADSIPHFDWQRDGFRMQQTLVDVIRGVDEENDPGYVPEGESRVKSWANNGFQDGAVDPSMKEARSEDLTEHNSPFWESTIQNPQEKQDTTIKQEEQNRKRPVPWKLFRRICAGFAVGFLFLFAMRFFVFNVEEVRVEGNSTVKDEEVLKLAGIRTGMNILTLDEAAITKRIDSNRYLKLEAVEKKTNHLVVLHVRESQEASFIRYCGIIYTLDVRGMVLDEWLPKDEKEGGASVPDLLQVEGLDIKSCSIGRKIALNDSTQMPIYKEFVMELKAMGMEQDVTTLYLTDTNSIYLGTEGGFSVRMGNADRIHAKLRSLQLVLEKIRKDMYPEGTIDVSTPEVPTYIPASSM